MDTIQVLAGLAGIGSLIFAIFEYLKNRENRLTETAKLAIQKERMRSLHFNIISAMTGIDQVVQFAKRDDATIESMQELARMVRSVLVIAENQIRTERGRMKEWRYGKLVETNEVNTETEEPAESRIENNQE